MLDDQPLEWRRHSYLISTDRRRLDLETVLLLLHDTHWGGTLTSAQLVRAVARSVCFGIYAQTGLVGFGRVVTDLTTFGYLTDIVVAPAHRGRGLGTWLVECIARHPDFLQFRRLCLLTRFAAPVYERAGFHVGPKSGTYMEWVGPADAGIDQGSQSQ